MAAISLVGEFYKNGKLLYYGQIFAGVIGLHTVMRVNSFAISLNARITPGNLQQNINELDNSTNSYSLSYLMRKVAETVETYEEATQMLSNSQLVDTVFYNIIGTKLNEGMVITRNDTSLVLATPLSSNTWYVV